MAIHAKYSFVISILECSILSFNFKYLWLVFDQSSFIYSRFTKYCEVYNFCIARFFQISVEKLQESLVPQLLLEYSLSYTFCFAYTKWAYISLELHFYIFEVIIDICPSSLRSYYQFLQYWLFNFIYLRIKLVVCYISATPLFQGSTHWLIDIDIYNIDLRSISSLHSDLLSTYCIISSLGLSSDLLDYFIAF